MTHSEARVTTPNASRYLQQLCKHWAHKFTVEFDPARGHIDFGEAGCTLAAGEDALHLSIAAPQAEMDKWEDVVARHLERFAFREELTFDWRRAA